MTCKTFVVCRWSFVVVTTHDERPTVVAGNHVLRFYFECLSATFDAPYASGLITGV